MRSSTTTLTAPDGTELFVRTWLPDEDEPIAIMQLAHGMAEHSGRYEPLARDLTADGYAVWIHDHRGHGDTAATARDEGYFADKRGWDTVVEDIHVVADAARAAHPGLPMYFLGHSMGSLLGRDYVTRYGDDLTGAIFSGTMTDAGPTGRVGQLVATIEGRARGRRHTSRLMNAMTFGSFNKAFRPTRTDFDWLSRDEAVVDAYIADPACGKVFTSGFFADLLSGVNRLPRLAGKVPADLPVYFFSGELDPVGGKGVRDVANAVSDAGVEDVTCRIYPDGRHEMLNEINRDEVVADLLAWLDAHPGRGTDESLASPDETSSVADAATDADPAPVAQESAAPAQDEGGAAPDEDRGA